MMDIMPTMVDGAVVLQLTNDCSVKLLDCEDCSTLTINIHNWVKQTEVPYLILDLEERKISAHVSYKKLFNFIKD